MQYLVQVGFKQIRWSLVNQCYDLPASLCSAVTRFVREGANLQNTFSFVTKQRLPSTFIYLYREKSMVYVNFLLALSLIYEGGTGRVRGTGSLNSVGQALHRPLGAIKFQPSEPIEAFTCRAWSISECAKLSHETPDERSTPRCLKDVRPLVMLLSVQW